MKHFFKAMSVAILLVAISIFYQSCQKESVIDFELSVKDRSDNYAIITWSDLTNGTDGEYLYSVYLNSELIVENTIDNTYSFTNLTGNTSYQCRVVAKNEKLGTVESTKSFTTFINYPPTAFEINSDSITSTSFSLHWNTSDDPERRALKYTVFVNNVVCFENYTQKSLVLRGLNAATLNSIRVIAFDDQNNSTTSSLNIRTLQKSNALLLQKTILWDGVKRSFAVYLPSYLNNSMPLVIHFHGAGGFAWPQIQSTVFKDVAEENSFIFVFPQATIWDQPNIPSWNVESYNPVDDAGFVEEMLQQLVAEYPINEKRVYACGMSSGGYMTYYLAAKMGDKLAAIAPVAGLAVSSTYNGMLQMAPLPLLHIHGTNDVTVGMNGGYGSLSVNSIIDFWVQNNFCNETPIFRQLEDINPNDGSTVEVYEYLSPYYRKDVVLYKIINGGHSWPGAINDPRANKDIIAESEIWNFFGKYTLN